MEQDYFGAFRAQLILPEQRQLFDYWVEKSGSKIMPARSDLNPREFPRLLPNVSLINVADDLKFSTFRLAGTRIYDIHGCDITGLTLADVDWHNHGTYWPTAYANTMTLGEPTHGTIKTPSPRKAPYTQVWLRLPLSSNAAGKVDMVLCYDRLIVTQAQSVETQIQG